jgi:hypothetical protein
LGPATLDLATKFRRLGGLIFRLFPRGAVGVWHPEVAFLNHIVDPR